MEKEGGGRCSSGWLLVRSPARRLAVTRGRGAPPLDPIESEVSRGRGHEQMVARGGDVAGGQMRWRCFGSGGACAMARERGEQCGVFEPGVQRETGDSRGQTIWPPEE